MLRSALLIFSLALTSLSSGETPNIVLIFADDVGYGDLGCYGSSNETPALDKLANQGVRALDFNSAANVCSPSRAALLTGRYPMRNGHPYYRTDDKEWNYGLHPEEITVAEQLKKANYTTYALGKWHLGFEKAGSHPMDQGFDSYYGLAYNYSTRHDPYNEAIYRNRKVEEAKVKFPAITPQYNDELKRIIGSHPKEQPFFLYMAHQIAHSPIAPSADFQGVTGKGKYADFLAELDHSCQVILDALEENGFSENTLVVFTSDNGHVPGVGSGGPLSGGKYGTMEGGHRVPFIARWPGQLPENNTVETTISSMDLFPLFSSIAGVELPTDRVIDGKNILSVLRGKTTASPHELLYYYNGTNLQAVSKGKWKLHLPREAEDQPFWGKVILRKKAPEGKNAGFYTLNEPFLVNLETNLAETKNVADDHPEVVAELLAHAEEARSELGDVGSQGSDQRPLWPPRP
ncbi:MAG: sulfatase-like hydrolase/transferase [Verrucomicrobiota bacterium JB023]|nr:sulfatase-like hydrolase/transferase [Verrucomicrobiota bacterium JB023]